MDGYGQQELSGETNQGGMPEERVVRMHLRCNDARTDDQRYHHQAAKHAGVQLQQSFDPLGRSHPQWPGYVTAPKAPQAEQ